MPPSPQSPIHDLVSARRPQWGEVGGTPIALNFGSADAEARAVGHLALCDVSAMPKLNVKGPAAEAWLASQGVDVPEAIYETRALADGGVVARQGSDEFFFLSGSSPQVVPALSVAVRTVGLGVYSVDRQDATFLLSGRSCLGVLSQTCGIDFTEAAPRCVVMTRVAGVSCAVLPEPEASLARFRLWLDPSYAHYLWEQLARIVHDLDGSIVGAACFYPDLVP